MSTFTLALLSMLVLSSPVLGQLPKELKQAMQERLNAVWAKDTATWVRRHGIWRVAAAQVNYAKR